MTARHTKQTHNFIAFGIDVIFFGLALKFIDPTTILPAFATQLGASSTLLGLLITTFHLAWSLPQLAAGNVVARYPSKKPALLTHPAYRWSVRLAFLAPAVRYIDRNVRN